MGPLFGDMFEEEGEGDQICDHAQHIIRKADVPLPTRSNTGLCGIYNQGATCYLNSLLQTLLLTPEFREELFQLGADELGLLEDKDKPGSKVRVIPIQLQKLFARMMLLNQQGVGTVQLTESFGWKDNEEFQQHDVQELNRILFSALEESLVGTKGQNLIRNLYHGKIVNQIICQVCGRISEREEDFLDLCIAVSGNSNLEDGLESCYVETELMTGKNQYRCERCNKLVDAVKGAKLRHLPPILSVSLLRFSFDLVKLERFKETGKFEFPMEINMSRYCESPCSIGPTEYELYSVVIHSGSGHGGHYHAYIRDVDNLGTWTSPDEEVVSLPKDPATGKVDYLEFDSPIDLVQAILQPFGHHGITVDRLCSEMNKQTGVSWNKRFKKTYGPINKFLKKHDDKFVFNQAGNWVSLKDYGSQTNATETKEIKEDLDNLHINQTSQKRPSSPPPQPGWCWYDFDDLHIHPIRAQEISKQFSGKQSAYMLFYRQKCMTRPQQAVGNPYYGIPQCFTEEVADENMKLSAMRMEYELHINTISVHVHFSSFYTLHQGALNKKDPETFYIELELDRRKTVGDLKAAIIEHDCADLIAKEFVIHRAKDLPAGLHLYNKISGDDSVVIQDTSIEDKSLLFVWDGKMVDGQIIPIGEDLEPLLLTVTYGNPCCLHHAFPSLMTVGELRLKLADMTNIPAHSMSISRIITKAKDMSVIGLHPEQDGASLAELKFSNGDHLIAENKSISSSQLIEKAVLGRHGTLSVTVENRCVKPHEGAYPVHTVVVKKDATVGELKAIILSHRLVCEVAGEGRLRIDDENLGIRPPLHEDQTVDEACLKPGCRVVLEPGLAPLSHQMSLRFRPKQLSSEQPDLEIVIDRSATVQQCLELMVKTADVSGDSWHICRTNWCGEVAEALDDLSMTLEACHLREGDLVLLIEGKIPPKGSLILCLWLMSPPAQVPPGNKKKNLKLHLEAGLQGNLEGVSVQEQNCLSLGDVIIAKEASLRELKERVISLDLMSDLVPSIEFLRIRHMENFHLSTILRNHSQTLQRLKLKSGLNLAVQVLNKTENLSSNHIVLSICQRIADTRVYTMPEEMTYDALLRGLTGSALKYAVATFIKQAPENIILAKHIPEKYEWLIIKETVPSKNTKYGKQKKKAGPKGNLRHAPYYLKDGDVIGVKNLQFNPFNIEDFGTADDDEGKERLRKEAEERKQRRKESRQRNIAFDVGIGGGDSKQKPEAGIKIHVGNFRS